MEVHDNTPPRYYPSTALSLDELAYWIAFSRVSGIGPVSFKRLLDYFADDVESAWQADSKALHAARLNQHTIEQFLKQRPKIIPQQELERLERLRVWVITWRDESYPPLLKKIEYAPPVLYVCGNLTEDDRHYTLGIVGTRKMSTYGRQVTERFASELARSRITIVSGLALGVDTVAHTTALDVGGRTIAVLACGLDVIYPAVNHDLAKRIVESGQGALLTSFPLGVKPESGNFPARNHLISGLSQGILVTEAPPKSGALITATSALNQGREVFAVPGGIFSPGGAGVNKLIQDGAHPVTNVNDIVNNLNLFMLSQQVEAQVILPENAEEQKLLSLLSHEACHIDELIRESQLPANTVSAVLTMMELKGMIRQVGGMHYVLSET
ncbi:DNA-protecting protein DprA [Ktedonosporobacter rubrisoli]|uniref:DNA-protecting protein DprA n=1 Tax=Ktedonosporobacter rubrisoli TaxID=2509675 RepID=A0A4P6JV79_KTERU|nr:DNA-processing protein DprA [Ktedonosporobacter rubrisoli]QBD79315.1 DNA-protecting protein DprA [Ktedonosporobacter rubrisoli]